MIGSKFSEIIEKFDKRLAKVERDAQTLPMEARNSLLAQVQKDRQDLSMSSTMDVEELRAHLSEMGFLILLLERHAALKLFGLGSPEERSAWDAIIAATTHSEEEIFQTGMRKLH